MFLNLPIYNFQGLMAKIPATNTFRINNGTLTRSYLRRGVVGLTTGGGGRKVCVFLVKISVKLLRHSVVPSAPPVVGNCGSEYAMVKGRKFVSTREI